MNRNTSKGQIHALPVPCACYQMTLVVGSQRALMDESGVSLCRHHSTMVISWSCIIWGMNNRLIGASVLRRLTQIDMIIIKGEEIRARRRKLHNYELRNLYCSADVGKLRGSYKEMWSIGKLKVFRAFRNSLGKSEGTYHMREQNIDGRKMVDINEIVCEVMHLIQLT
jgi:hypothetical protein